MTNDIQSEYLIIDIQFEFWLK